MTIVQKENGISNRPMAERSAIPVTMPGKAMGRTSKKETASSEEITAIDCRRSKCAKDERSKGGKRVQLVTDKVRASQRSARCSATPNHFVVKPGSGKVYVASSVVKEYRKMIHSGTCRKSKCPNRAERQTQGCFVAIDDLERIESSQFAGDQKINDHDHDRSHRQCGGERNIPRCALIENTLPVQ